MNKEYLKSINYNFIDITAKIKVPKDYDELIKKANDDKYSNVIFSINLKKINEELRKILKFYLSIDKDNFIIYYNKDNFCYYEDNFNIPINRINNFLEQGKKSKYECMVCFELFDSIHICHKCNFETCSKCIMEIGKNKYKNEIWNEYNKGNMKPVFNINCITCGTTNGQLQMTL